MTIYNCFFLLWSVLLLLLIAYENVVVVAVVFFLLIFSENLLQNCSRNINTSSIHDVNIQMNAKNDLQIK